MNLLQKKYNSTKDQILCLNSISKQKKLKQGERLKILINTNKSSTEKTKNSTLDCRITLPRRLYFSIYYFSEDNAFKRASDTWKRQIKNDSKVWDYELDEFLEFEVKTEAMFKNAWEKIRVAESSKAMVVVEGHIFSHASKSDSGSTEDGLEFKPEVPNDSQTDGTLKKSEIQSLPLLHWSLDGSLHLHGCNTGKEGTQRDWSPGKIFSKNQKIKIFAENGFSYFSKSSKEYIKIKNSDDEIYLHAYSRGQNVTLGLGSGNRIQPQIFIPAGK